jgi:hypothetical protein
MKIPAQIHPPDTTRAVLECLGLSIRPPPRSPTPGPDTAPVPEIDTSDDVDTADAELDLFT